MKNIFAIFIFTMFLINCSKIKQNNIELQLLNDKIYYIEMDSLKLLSSFEKNYEDITDYNLKERKKACNVLTFKLINNTNKKYFFVINTNEFDFYGNSSVFKNLKYNDSISIRRMCYLISNKNFKEKNLKTSYSYRSQFKNDSMSIYYKKHLEIENKIFKDKYMNFYDELNINHSFVLSPGEYKIFRRKLYLPIDIQKNYNSNFIFNSIIIPPNNQYEFCLAISSNKNDIWTSLQDYQRKELEDNGCDIFNGNIISNKVSLILRK